MAWGMDGAPRTVRTVVTLLVRNRLLLLASLSVLGTAAAITVDVLRPDGPVRARHGAWGPRGALEGTEVVGYASDRFGGECGLARVGDGARRALPGCHAYLAPEVVRLAERTVVVWERADHEIAVSTIAPDLSIEHTVSLPRPRTQSGTLLPRTDVAMAEDRLAIRYLRGQVVTVGADLVPWPGGALEVASARLGPRGGVLVLGALGLVLLYFMAAGWALALPQTLARKKRQGRCVEVTFPDRGSQVVVDGRAIDIELGRADFFGISRDDLGGADVTLVLDGPGASGDAYRALDRMRPAQVWVGHHANAMAHAKAVRAGAIALAAMIASILLFALDAYLVW